MFSSHWGASALTRQTDSFLFRQTLTAICKLFIDTRNLTLGTFWPVNVSNICFCYDVFIRKGATIFTLFNHLASVNKFNLGSSDDNTFAFFLLLVPWCEHFLPQRHLCILPDQCVSHPVLFSLIFLY